MIKTRQVYVVEHEASLKDNPHFLYMEYNKTSLGVRNTSVGWTKDISLALWIVRKKDAEMLAAFFKFVQPHRVVQRVVSEALMMDS